MAYTLKLSDHEIERYRRMAEKARELEGGSWTEAGVLPGARIADVGCGPGLVLCELARAVGPAGEVVGVEREPDVVGTASAIIEREGLSNARAIAGEASDTGLEPGTFDVVMMRHVLAHNGGREQQIVDHLATLLKPGGHAYLVDVDAGGFRMVPPDPELDELERIYEELHRRLGNDLTVGTKLAHLLDAAGLEVVGIHGSYNVLPRTPELRGPPWAARETLIAQGLATPEDFDRWEQALRRDGERPGLKLVYFPVLWAIGRAAS